jgi:hypothetical protein
MQRLMAACCPVHPGKWTKPAIVAIILAIFYLKACATAFRAT